MQNKKLSRRNFIKNSTVAITGTALLPSILQTRNAEAAKTEKDKMFCYQCEQTLGGQRLHQGGGVR